MSQFGHLRASRAEEWEDGAVVEALALFDNRPERENLAEGAVLLRKFALDNAAELIEAVLDVADRSPFRHLETRGGYTMSVAMTNCGEVGWISDRSGYRYGRVDPKTGMDWPDMPECFRSLARRAAQEGGFDDFEPDACLVNRYKPGARMSLHQDRNEKHLTKPIVSVSLGLSATFLWGGLERNDKAVRHRLDHGDVVVWGGPARMTFHGVAPLKPGEHHATGALRYNITFRATH